jgi:hypothetical protein
VRVSCAADNKKRLAEGTKRAEQLLSSSRLRSLAVQTIQQRRREDAKKTLKNVLAEHMRIYRKAEFHDSLFGQTA